MTVAQYEVKFTSLSRFAKAFMSSEEEKAKQFMRGLSIHKEQNCEELDQGLLDYG